MIPYPHIDPVALSIGPLAVRWYGLMYVVGFAAAWGLARLRSGMPQSSWSSKDVDDLIFYSAIGVIVGGRVGWVIAYGTEDVLAHPLLALEVWKGGMSFHGGLLGVVAATSYFSRRSGRSFVDVADYMTPLPGIGIFAGRIGNFINGELWGKPSSLPWSFLVDPSDLHPTQAQEVTQLCRRLAAVPCVLKLHPSQLYEALLEGLVLFLVIWCFTAVPRPRLAPTGGFLLLYGVFRFVLEFVRIPDENRGYFLFGWVTMGQILSAPMILIGATLFFAAYYRRDPSGNYSTSRR